MKSSLPLFLFVVILFSCNTHAKNGSSSDDPIQLSDSSFYNIDSVRAAMAGGNEQAGQKKLLQAIDVYINAKDPGKSIDLFKIAIRLQPSAKAYFELGCALLDDSVYEDAIKSLHIAEKLGYSPLANVMYRLSEAHAFLTRPGHEDYLLNDSLSTHYMEVALQMGYARPGDFRKRDIFGSGENYQFSNTYNNALAGGAGNTNPDKVLWETFKNEFHPADLPLTINTVWIQQHTFDNPIGYDYEKFVPEMRNAKFSREVEKEYYYFALVKKDTGYTALLYAGKNNFLTDANKNNPVFFLLTTYNRNGRIIDKMPVAGQSAFTDVFKVLTLQPNGTFIIKDYKNIYKDDPEQAGYDSNYVIRSEPLGTAAYRIAADGKFEKTDAPLAMR